MLPSIPANAGFYGEEALSFLRSYVLAELPNRNRKQYYWTSLAKGSSRNGRGSPRYPQNLAHLELGAPIESDSNADLSRAVLAGDPTSRYAD